jgi:hypothetical protein
MTCAAHVLHLARLLDLPRDSFHARSVRRVEGFDLNGGRCKTEG